MTFNEVERELRRLKAKSLTLDPTPNNMVCATAWVSDGKLGFVPVDQWGASAEDAVSRLLAALDSRSPNAAAAAGGSAQTPGPIGLLV